MAQQSSSQTDSVSLQMSHNYRGKSAIPRSLFFPQIHCYNLKECVGKCDLKSIYLKNKTKQSIELIYILFISDALHETERLHCFSPGKVGLLPLKGPERLEIGAYYFSCSRFFRCKKKTFWAQVLYVSEKATLMDSVPLWRRSEAERCLHLQSTSRWWYISP